MNNNPKILIIGAGFSGLCMGIGLKQQGIHDFLILEKASDLGGTWRENTYPGAECDIPSALYSYSFEHNSKWEYKWSGQTQILKYQHDTAEKYGLLEHIRFNQEVTSAHWHQDKLEWQCVTVAGDEYSAQHLIAAVGQLHHPNWPYYKNASAFSGDCFHSANWDHSVNLEGKRVAVIGNAASAVQFVPIIAPQVKHLTVFQRSPNWMLPKLDRPYTQFEQWVSEKFSWVTKLYRLGIWLKGELGILPAIRGNRFSRWLLFRWNQRMLKQSIDDPELRRKLTPDYPIGAKRILFADDYYPALARDNVALETQEIKEFTTNGIIKGDGSHEDFDVIIYSTGFKTNPFLAPMEIRGLDERLLSEHWAKGAHAYLGVNTAYFPNLHMLYGPNTNLGHNSIIIMIEAQTRYILQAINGLEKRGLQVLSVKPEVEDAYNSELQTRLQKLAFSEVAHSWYMDSGKITNNWAGGTLEYRRRLRQFDWPSYNVN